MATQTATQTAARHSATVHAFSPLARQGGFGPGIEPAGALDTHAQIAFDLGLDHARHALSPPAELMACQPAAVNPLRQGWEAGRVCFGTHTRPAGDTTRQWLSLRLQAWLRDVPFETLSVTPHYLGQLATSHCPVTRRALSAAAPSHGVGANAGTDAVIARLRDGVGRGGVPVEGYSAGHLATLSRVADLARAELGWDDALAMARRVEAAGGGRLDGLPGDAWRRLGVLLSFVSPLSHAQAARLPLLVLPPNRLHLCNPIQALQVLATRLLAHSGWSRRLPALLALLPQAGQREDFQRFFLALLARTLEAGQPTDPLRRRWALEDAWRDTEVQHLWWAFAWPLSAAQAESLVERAAARGLLDARLMVHVDGPRTCESAPIENGGAEPTDSRRLPVPLRSVRSRPTRLVVMSQQLALPWPQQTMAVQAKP